MLRIASACMSVSFERLDHLRLGLVLLADDLDQLVEVEIGDQVAVEDLEPPLDLGQPEGRAPHQHLAAMVEEGLQHLAQVHHPRRVVLVEHVEVERKADLEVGLPEQLLHQQLGRHVAGLRLEHDAHVVGRFVAHVLEDRQLLGVDELGDALDQLALLHLVGDLGDDDAVLAARQLLDLPARAQAEGAAAGPVGLDDRLARLDQHAAGREIRALHQVDQRVDAGVGSLDQMQQRVAELAGIVRRDRASPCRRRCRRRRWPAGWGSRRAARPAPRSSRRRWGGNRRRPRRCRPAAPRRPR